MAMRSESRVEAEVEEEENYGPQPLCRLEVRDLSNVGLVSETQLYTPFPPMSVSCGTFTGFEFQCIDE